MCFGIILGWVIGTQQAARRGASAVQLQQAAPAPAPAATGAPAAGTTRQPPPLDEAKVQSLHRRSSKAIRKTPALRSQLANTYFDAERYADAIKWYEEALEARPEESPMRAPISASATTTRAAPTRR